MLTVADCFGVDTVCWPAVVGPVGVTPSPQLTTEFGCTLTGPAGRRR